MAEQSGDRDLTKMTDAELRAEIDRLDREDRAYASGQAWKVHSVFVNQYHINVSRDGTTRLTFGEAQTAGGVPVAWRTSVTLSTDQALQLADFIYAQYDAAFPPLPQTQPPAAPEVAQAPAPGGSKPSGGENG